MYHKANLNRIMADYSSQPLAKIEEDTDRDRYMSPLEAKEYGIIDHIIGGEEAVFNVKGSLKRFPKVRVHRVCVRVCVCGGGGPGGEMAERGCWREQDAAPGMGCRSLWHILGCPGCIGMCGRWVCGTGRCLACRCPGSHPVVLAPTPSGAAHARAHARARPCFPPAQVKDEYVNDSEDLTRRNIMDGDPFMPETPSWRFKSPEVEPYMPSLAPGSRWFKVQKVGGQSSRCRAGAAAGALVRARMLAACVRDEH